MARSSTLNVSLTTSLNRYVRDKVATGGYESASEVIRESLRLFQTIEQTHDLFWTQAKAKVVAARKDIARGKVTDGAAAMNRIIAELSDQPARAKRRAK